jgi:oxygen-independent coproporphyrinogen-3 oxidase
MTETVNVPLSIYLHIPFCTTKCTYCAFNTYTNLENLIPSYVTALAEEIRYVASTSPYRSVHTVFFGGGTPSLLNPQQFGFLLDQIDAYFHLTSTAEVSVETNPNDLDDAYLRSLRRLGINRLSIGMQSAVENELKLFARRHDNDAVARALTAGRRAGYDDINLDLIYGAPHQTLESWRTSLEQALHLQPEHLSLYALGLEENTPMESWVRRGKLPSPDDDLSADMYDVATETLDGAGYVQYEISNWAKPGHQCQHNLQYWRNLPYIGLGPGAHGYAAGVRYDTVLSPHRYIKLMTQNTQGNSQLAFPRTPATNHAVIVDKTNEIAETLMMNLRLTHEGVSRSNFYQRFGVDLVELHHDTLYKFERYGLLHIEADAVRLTQQGRLLSNAIFRELV